MVDLFLIAYLLYALGVGVWIGDHAHELAWRLLVALEAVSEAILAFKHTIRAAL